MGKRQQRIVSYEAQGAIDFHKYGQRRFRWRKPCSESAAYNQGYARAKYGMFAVTRRDGRPSLRRNPNPFM